MVAGPPPERLEAAAERVRELAAEYEPPDFGHVPNADAALFLSAIDHGTGYERPHQVRGEGPYEGSALLWALGVAEEEEVPGTLTAEALADADEDLVEDLFSIEGETVSAPGERARLWSDLAVKLGEDYDGQAMELIAAARSRLGGEGGMLERLAAFEAFSDPLRKKSFLFCKIAERRGWLEVTDPESWEVCGDSVLMRLALRAGLAEEGPVEQVREATVRAFGAVAERAGLAPTVLDDLLWERGREDADLLGTDAGDLSEPPRPPGGHFY